MNSIYAKTLVALALVPLSEISAHKGRTLVQVTKYGLTCVGSLIAAKTCHEYHVQAQTTSKPSWYTLNKKPKIEDAAQELAAKHGSTVFGAAGVLSFCAAVTHALRLAVR